VATEVGAVREILGPTGFRVQYGDVPGAIRALQAGLAAPDAAGDAARQRILDNFLLARREGELLKVIEELIG
jgi:glycosyltransferase involved in cell wall biosynthesis